MSLPNELICVKYAQEKTKESDNYKFRIKTPKDILRAVSNYQGYHIDVYKIKDRKSDYVNGRKAYSQLCNKHLDYSLTGVGNLINRPHDNIIFYNKCEYKEVKEIIDSIEAKYIFPEKKKVIKTKLTFDQKLLIRTKLR